MNSSSSAEPTPTDSLSDELTPPNESTPTELNHLAVNIARAAGKVALDLSVEARTSTDTKSSPTDTVTMADSAAEKMIVEMLNKARPDDAILGEEGTNQVGRSGITWHVDPIDGTVNYVYELPNFCVSIAAARESETGETEVLAGAVFNPTTDEMYSAALGNGAYLNEAKISCSSETKLETALMATGFGYSSEVRKRQAQRLVNILPEIRDIRRFGSAALDLCAVARGQVDGYFESGLNQWDMTAGWLIAAESGAKVGNQHGGPPNAEMTIACPPELFDGLAALLCSSWQRES